MSPENTPNLAKTTTPGSGEPFRRRSDRDIVDRIYCSGGRCIRRPFSRHISFHGHREIHGFSNAGARHPVACHDGAADERRTEPGNHCHCESFGAGDCRCGHPLDPAVEPAVGSCRGDRAGDRCRVDHCTGHWLGNRNHRRLFSCPSDSGDARA